MNPRWAFAALALAACPSQSHVDGGGSTSGGTMPVDSGCGSSDACASLVDSCQSGACAVNVCPPDAGLYSLCDAGGALDGTCVPEIGATLFAACQQGGTAAQSCDLDGSRAALDRVCPAGALCRASGDGGVCSVVCDPETSVPCSGAQTCLTYGLAGNAGYCFDVGDGGCVVGLPGAAELSLCTGNAQCECPMSCTLDFNVNGAVCELPCTTAADCPNRGTTCVAGSCAPNYCAFDPHNHALGDAGFGERCDSADAGDGFCTPQRVFDSDSTLVFVYGLCRAAGELPAGAPCAPYALRDGGFCQSGTLCLNADAGFACDAVCSPQDGGPCASGEGCFSILPRPFSQAVGVCAACEVDGGPCLYDGECCSRTCDADAGACR